MPTNLPIPFLHECLMYVPETGKLYWKERPVHHFKNADYCRKTNSKCAGKEAFKFLHTRGYLQGKIGGTKLFAHRLAWVLHYGYWPNEIDHINHDKTDNRIANLRDVTSGENRKNMKLHRRNSTGCSGVQQVGNKFTARITVAGVGTYLGYFAKLEDAIHARKNAEVSLGFHKNHGVIL